MREKLDFIIAFLLSNERWSVLLLVFLYGVVFVVVSRSRRVKRFLHALSAVFFYSEPSQDRSKEAGRGLFKLEREVEILRKSLTNRNVQARREAIQLELENQLVKVLPELVSRKLDEIKALDTSIDSTIQSAIDNAVNAYLDKYTPADVVAFQKERTRQVERAERAGVLDQTIDEQMRSAGRLKAVMINLFVMFNIGILLVYLFAAEKLSDRAITAIIGLYVSLAAFIVYIYRTSNFRSSVLLSLREDAKKFFDADDYLRRLKPGASPSERDIEVLKLLMLNRSEREKAADHPYEVVLKGVTNSNIQLKGGKILPQRGSKNDRENT